VQAAPTPHEVRKHSKASKIPIHNLLYTPMLTKFVFQGRPQGEKNMQTTHHTPVGQHITTTSILGKEI
jgi:hypothetical protein